MTTVAAETRKGTAVLYNNKMIQKEILISVMELENYMSLR